MCLVAELTKFQKVSYNARNNVSIEIFHDKRSSRLSSTINRLGVRWRQKTSKVGEEPEAEARSRFHWP